MIQDMRDALALRPDDALAHWFMGFALIAKDQPAEAIPELEKAVVLTDRGPGAIGVLICAYTHAGRRKVAFKTPRRFETTKPCWARPNRRFCECILGTRRQRTGIRLSRRGYQEQSNILQFL